MEQKRKLYMILVAVAAVALIGLIVLAVSLDSGAGNHSAGGQTQGTEDTSTTDTKSNETTEGTQDSTQDSTEETTESTQDTTEATQDTTVSTETTEGKENPTQGSEATKPDDKNDETTPAEKDKWSVTYEEYNAMSGAEQEKFYYSFASADDYFKWYNAAKKAYEDSKNDIVIGSDGSIDLGEILNGKP